MKYFADFHIHSHYSLATSKMLVPEFLDYWSRLKGLSVIGTGDFTHPGWTQELSEKLEPAEAGLFKLRNSLTLTDLPLSSLIQNSTPRFILSAEISTIFKKGDRVRKVHHVILAPDFATVKKIQQNLTRLGGNITSDGRPILGLPSRDLLELCLEASPDICFIPAHIWTPWFSVLGDKSGFDSIEECYDDLTPFIHALETGLSSDPAMNRRCGFLDHYTLVSNSDAHSPEKLGREANIFKTDLSYPAIQQALREKKSTFAGTIEFFPQEGKYHFDGHRKCHICWSPEETDKHSGICPACGKKITVGVMNRVNQLADREKIPDPARHPGFYSAIPLREILGELCHCAPGTKKVESLYFSVLGRLGPELPLLIEKPLEAIEAADFSDLSVMIGRMRENKIHIEAGYDGEYGKIKIYAPGEAPYVPGQKKLIAIPLSVTAPLPVGLPDPVTVPLQTPADRFQSAKEESSLTTRNQTDLNLEQEAAIAFERGPCLIIAGPGTGKTRVLTNRIKHLVNRVGVDPAQILAVTFTNKAAREMKNRLNLLLPLETVHSITCQTFHAWGFQFLQKNIQATGRALPFSIAGEITQLSIIAQKTGRGKTASTSLLKKISLHKQGVTTQSPSVDDDWHSGFKQYDQGLLDINAFDLDDLLAWPIRILKSEPEILNAYQVKHQWILIDEYQDINPTQYQLIRLLAPHSASNICVVGDPDQAIYGFRGANIHFIENFLSDYPGASFFRLKKSYRCSSTILKASADVIKGKAGSEDFLEAVRPGVLITIAPHATDRSEAEYIARMIEEMVGGVGFFSLDSQVSDSRNQYEISSLADFAILCRIGRQMEAIEKALLDHHIPYQRLGDKPFFQEEPCRTIIDILTLTLNPSDHYLADHLGSRGLLIPTPCELDLMSIHGEDPVSETIEKIVTKFLSPLEPRQTELLQKLQNFAQNETDNIFEFLKLVNLAQSSDTLKKGLEQVNVMTLHAAKGLEFKCVFIPGCEEGLLPYSIFSQTPAADPAEERRLLYVGMTRASHYLFLTHAQQRKLFRRHYHLPRSSFLSAIKNSLLKLEPEKNRATKSRDSQPSLFPEWNPHK